MVFLPWFFFHGFFPWPSYPHVEYTCDIPDLGYTIRYMGILKKIIWLGDSRDVLCNLPEEVKDIVGYALHKAQEGLFPKNAKPFIGFKPAVMEIVTSNDKMLIELFIRQRLVKLFTFALFSKKINTRN